MEPKQLTNIVELLNELIVIANPPEPTQEGETKAEPITVTKITHHTQELSTLLEKAIPQDDPENPKINDIPLAKDIAMPLGEVWLYAGEEVVRKFKY